jgi:hypothetical protein
MRFKLPREAKGCEEQANFHSRFREREEAEKEKV